MEDSKRSKIHLTTHHDKVVSLFLHGKDEDNHLMKHSQDDSLDKLLRISKNFVFPANIKEAAKNVVTFELDSFVHSVSQWIRIDIGADNCYMCMIMFQKV